MWSSLNEGKRWWTINLYYWWSKCKCVLCFGQHVHILSTFIHLHNEHSGKIKSLIMPERLEASPVATPEGIPQCSGTATLRTTAMQLMCGSKKPKHNKWTWSPTWSLNTTYHSRCSAPHLWLQPGSTTFQNAASLGFGHQRLMGLRVCGPIGLCSDAIPQI